MELLDEQRKASYFKTLAERKNIDDLDEVFQLIDREAKKGVYEILLPSRIDLTDAQVKTLESLGFYVLNEYEGKTGQWMIDWENLEESDY